MVTTSHLYKRRKRLGLNSKGCKSILEKAYKYGLRLENVKPKTDFYNYLQSLIRRENSYPIVYGDFVYIIADNNIGITVLKLPKRFKKTYQQLKGGNTNAEKKCHSNKKIIAYEQELCFEDSL